jgi:hypothetical protein
VANPFAGAVAIEVRQAPVGGPEAVYLVDDPRALATLLREVKIRGIQNGMFAGCLASSRLTVRHKDGSTFEAGVAAGCLMCNEGTLKIDDKFFVALNRQLSKQEGKPIDVRELLRPPAGAPPRPVVRPSRRSLTAGFRSLRVTWPQGRRLREAVIEDAKVLKALHEALAVGAERPAVDEKARSVNLQIVSKDGSTFYGHLVSETELFDFTAGYFSVAPAFVRALNREIGRLEGRQVDILRGGAPTEGQLKRERHLRALLAGARALRFARPGKAGTVVVDQPEVVAKLIGGLKWAEAPVRALPAKKRGLLVELTLKDGKKVAVTELVPGPGDRAGPALADLVEVAGFGQAWLDNQWRSRFQDHAFRLEQEAKERRSVETTALVCRDLPAFWKLVVSVSPHFREGGNNVVATLSAAEARPILAALAGAKFEKLDWGRARWEKEVGDLLDRDAGSLDLAPGLGFSLMVVVAGEKEMLIPLCGRLTFRDSPIPLLQRAIDAKKPRSVELLPRPR